MTKKTNLNALIKEQVVTVLKEQTMTRQHFRLIADVLANNAPHSELAAAFADALAMTNPRFNREAFIKAATGK